MAARENLLVSAFHWTSFLFYVYVLAYVTLYVRVPPPHPGFEYAGRAKFLTHWNLVLAAVYFGLCSWISISPSSSLKKVRDKVFSAVSLPSCLFVAVIFWGLYAVDRELVFPRSNDKYYPAFINHGSHTVILVTALIEAVAYRRVLPSKTSRLIGLAGWFACYLAWILFLGNAKDIWVYPVLRKLDASSLTLLLTGFAGFVLALFVICDRLLRIRSGPHRKSI